MNTYSFFILLFFSQLIYAQGLRIDKLSDKIYDYNNNLQYKKSQDTLLNLLEDNRLSAQDKLEVNILLSLTYKRLQDYTSVKYYLSNAKTISEENKLVDFYNKINAQFAFAYFDTQDYNQATEIMNIISKHSYRNLSPDDKAIILMQEGFIHYRNKNFSKADAYYERAALLMKKSNSCDLPIVYGKQIQLYFSLNEINRALEYYKMAVNNAKHCKILKYELYLAEVMMNFYKEKNKPYEALEFTKKFDSLNTLYKPTENLQILHLNRDLKAQHGEQNAKKSGAIMKIGYLLAIVALFIIIFFITRYALISKKNNALYLNEIESMKQILINYQAERNRGTQLKSKLNGRQLLMLEMMKDGKSNKEIGSEFNITESTVKYHIKSIYESLNIKNRKDLKDII